MEIIICTCIPLSIMSFTYVEEKRKKFNETNEILFNEMCSYLKKIEIHLMNNSNQRFVLHNKIFEFKKLCQNQINEKFYYEDGKFLDIDAQTVDNMNFNFFKASYILLLFVEHIVWVNCEPGQYLSPRVHKKRHGLSHLILMIFNRMWEYEHNVNIFKKHIKKYNYFTKIKRKITKFKPFQ